MTDQQPTIPPPAGRRTQQKPTVRHWDGNGWTQPTPTAAPAAPVGSAADRNRGRKRA
jgi:hypothetical protein